MTKPDLFGGQVTPIGPARPRPADSTRSGAAEYVQVEAGVWTVVVYTLIPKLGFGHVDFPHYFGGPPEEIWWRVDRHAGGPPGGTFLFDSREHAERIVAEVFGGATSLFRFMSRISIPTDDRRSTAAGRRRRRRAR